MQMRRSIAMEEGHFARALQDSSRIFPASAIHGDWIRMKRFKWAEGLDVPFAKEGEHYDLLYWVGCSASYDKRNQKIAKAMIKILKASGLSFAVMQEESCNAELARRVGDEYLFECQTLMNIENLESTHSAELLRTALTASTP